MKKAPEFKESMKCAICGTRKAHKEKEKILCATFYGSVLHTVFVSR